MVPLRVISCILAMGLFFKTMVGGSPSWGQPREPVLSIELGTNTGRITAMAVDSSARILVTVGTDKTARVWDVSGEKEPLLLRTLRPPIASGHEGKLYAVAVTPDGRVAACGGQTGKTWEGESFVYFFDLSTGELLARSQGLPGSVQSMAYSPDGQWLAVGLFRGGLRILSTGVEDILVEDREYGAAILGVDFSKEGGLMATTCLDGLIRLYDLQELRSGGNRSGKVAPISKFDTRGGLPVGIAFCPRGSHLALGFRGDPRIEVLEIRGRALYPGFSPNLTGVAKGHSLLVVAWSKDGDRLYAAGGHGLKGQWHVRKWEKGGTGEFVDIPVSRAPVSSLISLPKGGIAYSTSEPGAFGILDQRDNPISLKEAPTFNPRYNSENLLISPDGWTVQFCFESRGRAPAIFSVQERSLADPNESFLRRVKTAFELRPPVTKGLNIRDWKNSLSPKLQDRPLDVPGGGFSRSLAILPDLSGFVLGADWSVSLLDTRGRVLWTVPTHAAFAVNTNGKVVVAAMGDGTIRWFRVSDGKEILGLFPHKDKKRWIMWTPSGYYEASAGGEDLVGWHVNRGKDREGDFFPASRFRAIFARSDVIDMITITLDEKEALSVANRESGREVISHKRIEERLPPVVRIVEPMDLSEITSSSIILRYSARTSEPLTSLKVLVDGRPTLRKDDPGELKKKGELRVPVPSRDCEISLIAENSYGAGEAATIRLKWKGPTVKEEFQMKPNLYVLAVGVSSYQQEDLRLGLSAKDALDFGEVWKNQKGILYAGVEVRVLTDAQATKGNILDGLEWLQREVTHKDVAVLFFAGHGINDPNGVFYFLPVDADPQRLKRTGVSQGDIASTVAGIAGKVLVFIDACHSGNIMGKSKRRAHVDLASVVNELASAENGAIVFSSSTGRQYSLENPEWGNGAFTKALVEGIRGKADFRTTGRITVNMLDLYVSERVKELTEGRQTPTTVKPPNVPDFPVAVRR